MKQQAIAFLTAIGLLAIAPVGYGQTSVIQEEAKLNALDGAAADFLGRAVSVYGDTAVVGAHGHGHGANNFEGAAYVFERDAGGPGNWGQVAKLEGTDSQSQGRFGAAVALSGDTALVGAYLHGPTMGTNGAAFVFERDAGGANQWDRVAGLSVPGASYLGWSVAISGDTAVTGAILEGAESGATYVFERDAGGSGKWGQVARLTASDGAPDDNFGDSVSIVDDTVVVGCTFHDDLGEDSGAAYVFRRDAGGAEAWGQVAKLLAPDGAEGDRFGNSVSISGDTIVIAAVHDDDNGGNSGSAYVFQETAGGSGSWAPVAKLLAFDGAGADVFGAVVSISQDTVVAGAYLDDDNGGGSGSAHVFQRDAGGPDSWGQVAKLLPSDGAPEDRFGVSVSISGDTVAAGAYQDDDVGSNSGSAYVFRLPGGSGATPYCFCASGAPCGNEDAIAGCRNSTGVGASLVHGGTTGVADDHLVLTVSGVPPNQFGIVYMGPNRECTAFGDGLRAVQPGPPGSGYLRFPIRPTDSTGSYSEGPGIVAFSRTNFGTEGEILPGSTWNFQGYYRDPSGPWGFGFNLSNALTVVFGP